MSEEDVHDKLVNPPPVKLITDGEGTFVRVMQLNDVLRAPYRRCKICTARFRCSRVQKDPKNDKKFLDVDCVIEKEALDVLLTKLSLDGVTDQDEILVFPLVRNVFQLIRLYELESIQSLSTILRDDEKMKVYKEINSMINKSETQVVKFLKELMATRKEDQKKTISTIKDSNKKYDLARKLGAKKSASQKEKLSKGKTKNNT